MPRPYAEIFHAFAKLGVTSFGGPVAHLGFFRDEIVVKRRWLDEAAYADLIALCQFLPGPSSSQVCFALGLKRGGLIGGLIASLAFTLPSAVAMILFALGVEAIGDIGRSGWLQGLKVAAVGVVAHAVLGMARQLCPDAPRILLAVAAMTGALILPGVSGQLLAMAGGGFMGYLLYRRVSEASETRTEVAGNRKKGAFALALFALLLVGLPILAGVVDSTALAMFERFYRSGALVFGGGHVVLPLLRAEVVPPGWISDETFLAGYGAAQAIPGPLFTFSAFLGAAMKPAPHGWLGGAWCLIAIFLPALLLVGGALPFWERLRASPAARAALRGTNAAVVGVLAAALCTPVMSEGIRSPAHALLALLAFLGLQILKMPAWAVVLVSAGAGSVVL